MRFRPCIDIHNGKVKQIVGGSLRDWGDQARDNFVADRDADYYADLYRSRGLTGGHIILLNPKTSQYYEEDRRQAMLALGAAPGTLQIGGGITAENAREFLDAGASHVIVTSYVFREGRIDRENLGRIEEAAGRDRLVLDLSCRRREDAYYIVTDRWQKFTQVKLTVEVMEELSDHCDEFLVHAVDVEGKARGPQLDLVRMLGSREGKPVTYAGGIGSLEDLELLGREGRGRLDVTIGSALDLFGGRLAFSDVLETIKRIDRETSL